MHFVNCDIFDVNIGISLNGARSCVYASNKLKNLIKIYRYITFRFFKYVLIKIMLLLNVEIPIMRS